MAKTQQYSQNDSLYANLQFAFTDLAEEKPKKTWVKLFDLKKSSDLRSSFRRMANDAKIEEMEIPGLAIMASASQKLSDGTYENGRIQYVEIPLDVFAHIIDMIGIEEYSNQQDDALSKIVEAVKKNPSLLNGLMK